MVFIDDEQSLEDSRPEELFYFALGDTVWTQNSGTEDIFWNGRTWTSKLITRTNKNLTTNSLKNKLVLQTSLTNEFAQQFLFAAPDGVIQFILYRGQSGDYVSYWRGYVESVSFQATQVEITCSPMTSRLRRAGLQRKFGRLCGLTVYGFRCGLTLGTYEVTGVVDSSSGLTITSTSFGTKADGYFVGGYIQTPDYSRMIVYHVGDDIKLNSPIPSLADGTTFDAYRGCDHSIDTCIALNNNLNFGGHPWLPNKNPFVGDAIA